MKKIIKVTIVGGLGRMGRIIAKKIRNNKKFKLNNIIDEKDKPSVENIKIIKKTDVIIDFSRPKGTMQIIKIANRLKKKIVIGTTGFTKKQNNLIKNYSKKIAIFKSGNMSLGINLLEYIVNILSNKIPNNYKIGINDDHHKRKVDYPSGTALMLAKAVSNGRNKSLESMKGKIFLNKKGNLLNNKINFFITRKGNTIGKHSVIFNNKIENI